MRPGSLLTATVLLTACDPIWGVHARVRDPASRPIEGATLVLACREGPMTGATDMAEATDAKGAGHVAGMGLRVPVGCDVFVVKPGFRTYRLPYARLCPGGACGAVVRLEVQLDPE